MGVLKFLKGLENKLFSDPTVIKKDSIYYCEDTGNTYLGKEKENTDGTITKELLRYSSAVGKTILENNNIKGEIFNDYINNQANGAYSHAEGSNTNANGAYSHAEGEHSSASGYASHAEGSGKASNMFSHAEGTNTNATGESSHAEGTNTKATGKNSHAQGLNTWAFGENSHASGEGTLTLGNNQTVLGKYNLSNENDLYIIGNGEEEGSRSNAHTLDWEGNAWFAGDVYVKGSGQNDTENVHKLSYDSIEQQNTNSPHKNIKFWVGSQEELNAIEDRDDSCLYFTTGEDGEEGSGSGMPSIQTISLLASNWDINSLLQNINITGIIADPLKQIITVSPTSSSREEYLDCGVQCILQGTDSLTFKAESIPNSNLSVYIAIQKTNS